MANPAYFDRRKQTSTTTGTGSFTLAVPSGSWSKLNTAGAATITISYCIAHQTASDWETGVGTIDSTSTTLTRSATDGSAGASTLVNFSGGTKDVFITPIAANLPRVSPLICQGRLTVLSGAAAGEASSVSTIYFTPYLGSQIAVPETSYGAAQWKLFEFTEMSLALAGLTAGNCYDVYIYDNAGTLTLGTQAWANNTTRSVAVTNIDGIPMLTVNQRYLGTFYAQTATTTSDTGRYRFLWNYYNQVPRTLANFPNVGNWSSPGTLGWRAQNADATKARAVEFIWGLGPLKPVSVRATCYCNNPTAGTYAQLGLTLDPSGGNWIPSQVDCNVAEFFGGIANYLSAEFNKTVAVGYHYLQPTEAIQVGTGTVTWFDYVVNRFTAGISGTMWA